MSNETARPTQHTIRRLIAILAVSTVTLAGTAATTGAATVKPAQKATNKAITSKR